VVVAKLAESRSSTQQNVGAFISGEKEKDWFSENLKISSYTLLRCDERHNTMRELQVTIIIFCGYTLLQNSRETLSRSDPSHGIINTSDVARWICRATRVVRTDEITLEIGFAWRAALRHSDITPFAPNYIKFQNKMCGRNLHFPSGAHIRAAPLGATPG